MLAFGCSIIMPDLYERHARPGIERAREPDSVVLAHAAAGSVARSVNLMLDRAARLEGLEALVLVHQDAEILAPDFCANVRACLTDPLVAMVGCVGANGVKDIAWWDGDVTWNSAPYRYGEAGGGDLAFARPPGQRPGEVQTLYGVLLVLSPWAVANLRCDESIGLLHGYDFDLCRQARAAGRKVITADLSVAHHHSLDLVSQIEIWVAAHMRAAELWVQDAPDPDAGDEAWRPRARRAEASAAAARLLAASKLLQADASAQHHASQLGFVRNTRSWRMTESLRRGNALVRMARRRLESLGLR
ncbi:MAG: glycosyltransferase [Solirubrobacteraceae bacterium]